jgi:hypothetical protein
VDRRLQDPVMRVRVSNGDSVPCSRVIFPFLLSFQFVILSFILSPFSFLVIISTDKMGYHLQAFVG